MCCHAVLNEALVLFLGFLEFPAMCRMYIYTYIYKCINMLCVRACTYIYTHTIVCLSRAMRRVPRGTYPACHVVSETVARPALALTDGPPCSLLPQPVPSLSVSCPCLARGPPVSTAILLCSVTSWPTLRLNRPWRAACHKSSGLHGALDWGLHWDRGTAGKKVCGEKCKLACTD